VSANRDALSSLIGVPSFLTRPVCIFVLFISLGFSPAFDDDYSLLFMSADDDTTIIHSLRTQCSSTRNFNTQCISAPAIESLTGFQWN
jgi:hypothetical protein